MPPTPRGSAVLLLIVSLAPGALGQQPRIHTDRDAEKELALPDGEEMFQFVIFGDRTGGPPSGIPVLAQAVEETNLLDPDLVMTVGDLVNGYNQTEPWLQQMREYRGVMDGLNMPWFPVAGNHDIFWRRDPRDPEARPPREHEQNFERHFGPLWYWFAHKQTGFLVLFSDEGHPDGRPRDFTDPEQQQISPRQIEWMTAALAEMKDLRHVFVFLHHPFWWGERYPSNNWDEVHRRLVEHGAVRAVFAGHIHRMRYDGVRDGIEYYALSVTGGGIDERSKHQYFGALHHYDVVTVRPSGYSVASIPVGGVFDPRQFTEERIQESEAARYLRVGFASDPIRVRRDGIVASTCVATVHNPISLPLDVTVAGVADASWIFGPDHRHGIVEPGQTREFAFAVVRESGPLEGLSIPEIELRFDVLTPELRLGMPARRRPVELELAPAPRPPDLADQVLAFDGATTSIEVDRRALEGERGAFCVEAWIRPEPGASGGILGNLSIGGWSLELVDGRPSFRVQTDPPGTSYRTATRLRPPVGVAADDALEPGRWVHLAGVHDGQQILLFVDGRRVGARAAEGARLSSDRALLIGALPRRGFNLFNEAIPASRWKGALDDFRISRGVRQLEGQQPRRLEADAATVLHGDGDQLIGAFVPLTSDRVRHGFAQGALRVERSD